MNTLIKPYIDLNKDEIFKILKELCEIPAPSHSEFKRAEYCKEYFLSIGAKDAYIDKAYNVVFPLNCEKSDEITVFSAHLDTVFPEKDSFDCIDDGEKIFCPGVCDDTAGVVALLLMTKFFIQNKILPEKGIMFVCNSCEEGLGNLKGTRQIFEDYKGRISNFITFDSSLNVVNDRCVGSHRYEVEVITEGGHSFKKFGNKNAIAVLSDIITKIYSIDVPQKKDTKTTYNVGIVSGGTSVNTIAESAKMLCEYRSDDKDCLEFMRKSFEDVFNSVEGATLNVTKIGDRPCADCEKSKTEKLKEKIIPVIESVTGKKVLFESSSTDCNIPLSMGVPALSIGVCNFDKIHTKDEWIDKKMFINGIEVAIKAGLALM